MITPSLMILQKVSSCSWYHNTLWTNLEGRKNCVNKSKVRAKLLVVENIDIRLFNSFANKILLKILPIRDFNRLLIKQKIIL